MGLRQISQEFNIHRVYDIGHLVTRQWSEVSVASRAFHPAGSLEDICN